MQRHCENGLALAELLSEHPTVAKVHYPGLTSHPQHALAGSQMQGFGGLVSFELKGGSAAALSFMELRLVGFHSSLGGVTSNAIQPAALFGEQLPADVVASQGITPGLVRISAGLENLRDLLADVRQALA